MGCIVRTLGTEMPESADRRLPETLCEVDLFPLRPPKFRTLLPNSYFDNSMDFP
jgi:hypothetical protein